MPADHLTSISSNGQADEGRPRLPASLVFVVGRPPPVSKLLLSYLPFPSLSSFADACGHRVFKHSVGMRWFSQESRFWNQAVSFSNTLETAYKDTAYKVKLAVILQYASPICQSRVKLCRL